MSVVASKRKIRYWLAITALLASVVAMTLWLSSPEFGNLPEGQHLIRIQASPNYRDGEFRNQVPTTMLSGKRSRWASMYDHFFGDHPRLRPTQALPMVETDLNRLDRNQDAIVWLGHSSYYLQLAGKRILIDPVFSSNAAPLAFLNRAFGGNYPYNAAAMPDIDYLVISHDHWDHLDYPTLTAMRSRIGTIISPLGVGAHLARWGFDSERIHEADWYDTLVLEPGLTVHVLPARHFSGRLIRGNRTLWAGFMFETTQHKIFYSGDSGYGPHFAEIGQKFGAIDLAIMDNGQYDPDWSQIHMMPEEAVQGALDLRAASLLPAHSGRFAMANHTWDDPYRRIAAASQGKPFRLLTPTIGEVVRIADRQQAFTPWWELPGI